MTKVISPEQFKRGLAFANAHGGDAKINAHAFVSFKDWLDDIELEREYDTDYYGHYFPDELFTDINPSDFEEFILCIEENAELRLARFDRDGVITEIERQAYRESFINNACQNGDYPAVFTCEISDGNNSIHYIGTRRGHSFEGLYCEDLGVFLTLEQGSEVLFSNGAFVSA